MEKRVEGVYPSVNEALRAIDRLRNEGYSRDDITLVTNEEVRSNYRSDINSENADEEDRSFWDSVKNAFTTDKSFETENYDDPDYDHNIENDPVYAHKDAINDGAVVVLISDVPGARDTEINETTTNQTNSADTADSNFREDEAKSPDPEDSDPRVPDPRERDARKTDIVDSEPVDPSPMGSDVVNPGPANPRGTTDTNPLDPDAEDINEEGTPDNK